MKPFEQFPDQTRRNIDYVLTDIDATLTINGRLPAQAYAAMQRLMEAEIKLIPITGRPAGWCDHIARMWPVDGVVGENGAFYFHYDDKLKKMQRRYFKTDEQRAAFQAAFQNPRLRTIVEQWWEAYDRARAEGEIPAATPWGP